MKGRKPVPTTLKVLRGNPGKRAMAKNEPKPTPTAPACPTWLSREGKAEWRRVVPELDRIGMLSKVDRAALATYCEVWATFVTAQRDLHQHGLRILRKVDEAITDEGQVIIYTQPVKNPCVQIARDAAAQVRSFCAEFGLTQSARARIDLPEADEGDGGLASIFS